MKLNVLITGAGGNLAHFIWKAIERSSLDVRVVLCDYSHDAVGLFQAEVGYVIPPARSPEYLPRILELCEREHIHAVMAGGMVEMHILARHMDEIRAKTGAVVISSPPDVLERLEDKFALAEYLRTTGQPHPRTVLASDAEGLARFVAEMPFPYIIKDRQGAGSKGIGVAKNADDLAYLLRQIPRAIVQEYLYPDDEEYTVGCFVKQDGKAAGHIVMRRELGLGMTFKAEVLDSPAIGTYCEKILEGMGCRGPSNVQLRLTSRGPIAFEINGRFSSTTSARPHFGYNDAEMSLRHLVLGEDLPRPVIRPGRLFRMVEDVFVESDAFERARIHGEVRR
jgi:carbamoyl-phosphate synthase large subunit